MNRRFEKVALPHLDAAYNLARWLTVDAAQAEEVTQEAFLHAFKSFGSFPGKDARRWLLAIVRNVFHTRWRRTHLPEPNLSRCDDIRPPDQAMRALPVECREAIVLRELEDLSYEEIAAILDVPIDTVMSRLARSRLMLESLELTREYPR